MVPRIFAPTFLVYINFKPPGLEATDTSPLEVATSIPERMVWKNVSPVSNMASPFGYRHVIFQDGPLSFSPRITSQKKTHDIGKSRIFNRKYIFKCYFRWCTFITSKKSIGNHQTNGSSIPLQLKNLCRNSCKPLTLSTWWVKATENTTEIK